jgi:type I restriction enzyme R subunit
MTLHKEINFENEVCDHLGNHGWLYAQHDAAHYDRPRALFPADVLAWVQTTQPDAWKLLTKNHGTKAPDILLARLRDVLDQRGTLDVLRRGVEIIGLKQPIKLAEFKPALAINPDILARYAANRLRVVRQVRYSVYNENAIDLVLFLNGVPVATVELKTDFTQSVQDAIDQYCEDRVPHPKGQSAEPLLTFPRGALVHFAVSNREVHMTTRLAGADTQFLPFNQGDNHAAGNPFNPHGHPTAYLWEQVWARESWLEILGRYLITQRDKKKQIATLIFPRFHQLDVTRELQRAVLAEGPGGRYLIQHSAGSGKTNSIAWTAHFLAELHDAQHAKLFDTVLVVSDRNAIDGMLADALFDFERTTGVVATITGESSSKSGELAQALSGTKKIVVCTIQTFPFALEAVRKLAATQGKRFAVIADEAHSSQTGDAAVKLRAVLDAHELRELDDGGEVSSEDVLAAQMTARADDRGITFVAFTATPKQKTIELFGTRPDPSRKPSNDNIPKPFHIYSMQQAIEEGFILDVLQNYTPYSVAFKLAHEGEDLDDKAVERSAALKKVMGWVKLHPHNIAQKVRIVVDHYRQYVAPLLGGRAKAMIVLGSRLEAVRWQLAVAKYVEETKAAIATVVAFSGSVNDDESGPDPFTENSVVLNPKLKGRDIREAFKGSEYQLLLVANKFQTGFDEPLLCGMYVDKRLAGIQAVQTLSRLNRAHPGKDTIYVVDFVNDPVEVLAEFKKYHTTAELSATTDPNLVFDLRGKLDGAGHYDDREVDRVVAVELDPNAKQSELIAALGPIVERVMKRYNAAKASWTAAKQTGDDSAAVAAKSEMDAFVLFGRDMAAFVRLYTFLSPIFDYGDTAIEKRAIFYKRLIPLLEFGREREGIDLSKLKLTHHAVRSLGKAAMPLGVGEKPLLYPLTEVGSGIVREKETVYLSVVVDKLSSLFGGDLTDQDKVIYATQVIMGKILESELLVAQAASNSKEQFAGSPDLMPELQNAIIDALDAHQSMSTQALNSDVVQAGLADILLNHVGLWERLRERAAARSL